MKIRENYKTALMCTFFPIGICALLIFRFHQYKPAYVLAGIFFSIALLSIIVPRFGCFVYKYASKAGAAAGNFISKIILLFVWFLTVLPLGMLMKAVKRDALRLKKPAAKSYWIDNKNEASDYEYQF